MRVAEPLGDSRIRPLASARLLGRSWCSNPRADTCSPPAPRWGLQGVLVFRAPSRVRRSFALFSFGLEDTLEGKAQVIFWASCKGRAAYREWKSLITPFCLGIHLPGSVLHSYFFGWLSWPEMPTLWKIKKSSFLRRLKVWLHREVFPLWSKAITRPLPLSLPPHPAPRPREEKDRPPPSPARTYPLHFVGACEFQMAL